MIKATKNQLCNVSREFQGSTKKVLTVCSAGLLRSATLQNFLIKEYGYNVRNCGTVDSYALIPISEVLISWADEIVFVHQQNFEDVELRLKELDVINKCHILDIEDNYGFNDPKLIQLCKEQYSKVVLNKEKIIT